MGDMADYYIGLALDSGEGFGGYVRRPYRNKLLTRSGSAYTPKKPHPVVCQFCGAKDVYWRATLSGHVLSGKKTHEPHSCPTSAEGFEDCAP